MLPMTMKGGSSSAVALGVELQDQVRPDPGRLAHADRDGSGPGHASAV